MKEVKKKWGKERWLVNNELYCMKHLFLDKNYQCSIHHHEIKDETFIIDYGLVLMEHAGRIKIMKTGDLIRIKPGEPHRFTGIKDSCIIEVSTTHKDNDTYRKTKSGKVRNNSYL